MTRASRRAGDQFPSRLALVVVLGLVACSGGGDPVDAAIKPDLAFLSRCGQTCSDSRDCGRGLACVVYTYYEARGGCRRGEARYCIAPPCRPPNSDCINDLAGLQGYCEGPNIARIYYGYRVYDGGYKYRGMELVYCPNGCEDSCSSGGCDGGARGTNARCK